jgi:hypothetical protein
MFKKKEEYKRPNDTGLLIRKLEKIGVRVLLNENHTIEQAGGFKKIEVIGLDDPIIAKTDLKKAFLGIEKKPRLIPIKKATRPRMKYPSGGKLSG